MERMFRAHREEMRELVENNMAHFGRRIEGKLRTMGEHLTRAEVRAGPSGAKRQKLDLLHPEEIKKEKEGQLASMMNKEL